ncbi:uncharacterized protein [Haliotis asinina]|uniref:uncharacterized protein n=1 Tax=Haliotis asinina TaxID=109174 RepID=UPI0035322E2F
MLTDEEEESSTNYLVYMGNQGFPLITSVNRSFITTIMQRSGRLSVFVEAGPSDQWFKKFLGQHPELQERRLERQDRSRTRMSNQTVMDQYFTNYKEGVPGDWLFAVSESGYMDTELFTDWLTKIFVPNCGRTRPVLLILDNHNCHVQLAVLEIAKENEIEFLCLPTHIRPGGY